MTNALTITAEPGVPFIEFTRDFDASVEDVFRAHKEPDIIKQWLEDGAPAPTRTDFGVTSRSVDPFARRS